MWYCPIVKTKPFGCEHNPQSKYLVLGIPLDNSASYRPGTRFAPSHIREASCNIEFYSIYANIDIDNILYNDLGDLAVVPGDNEKSIKLIEDAVEVISGKYSNHVLFVLGGEHTLTYGVIKGMKNVHKEVGYIVFDAHLDLRENYLGYKLGHASTNRLITELLDIKPLIIGARAFSSEELIYARHQNIPFIKPKEINDKTSLGIIQDYLSTVKRVYISIDMDSIDPAYAPGVSNPEPLGLTPNDLLNILKYIVDNSPRVLGIDIVEVNPLYDVSGITSILAAKIIVETTGMIQLKL